LRLVFFSAAKTAKVIDERRIAKAVIELFITYL